MHILVVGAVLQVRNHEGYITGLQRDIVAVCVGMEDRIFDIEDSEMMREPRKQMLRPLIYKIPALV